jgi:predicted outer membrane repeat protein
MRKLLLLLFIVASGSSTAMAQVTHTVNDDGGGDFTTITAALAAATAGDILSVTGGADNMHTEAGITVSKDITIKGQGQSTTFIQAHATEGSATDRVFEVTTSGTDVIFQDMTIRHGKTTSTGGGVLINLGSSATGTATFTNVTISNNETTDNGGGLYVSDDITTVTMTDCIITNNTSTNGGGIYQAGAVNFTMTNCVISNNTVTVNGGGADLNKFGSTNTLIKCVINGNTSDISGNDRGGGLSLIQGIHILKNCTIYNNETRLGGGIYDGNADNNISLYHCTIANNSVIAGGDGGGIYFNNSTISPDGSQSMTNCIISDNTRAGFGNDIHMDGGTITNASDADHNWVENCDANGGICPSSPPFVSTSGSLGAVTACPSNSNMKVLEITSGSPAENIGKAQADDAEIPTDDICGGTRNATTPDAGSFEIGTSLPVELVSFAGRVTDRGHLLTWITASETNNEGFEIERSTDGKNWKNLDFVAGNGSTQQTHAYNFLDDQPLHGINYYRLKQMDFDGIFEYSNIVNVNYELGIKNYELKVFPNPVQNELNIVDGQGQATIYNLLGQEVRTFNVQTSSFKINTTDLPKGQYILHITQSNGNVITKRFVK